MIKLSVLSALPHSQQDLTNCQQSSYRDYVRTNLCGYSKTAEEIWEKVKAHLGYDADNLFHYCQAQGIKVYQNARLEDLTIACETSDIVIVLSHWKGPNISEYPPDLVASMDHLCGPLEECVRKKILNKTVIEEAENKANEHLAKEWLAQSLNYSIRQWGTWFNLYESLQSNSHAVMISQSFGTNFAREIINQIFGSNTLIPGARLELADGLWAPEAIRKCIPPNWDGMCDFVCCTSEYLASELSTFFPKTTFRSDSRLLNPNNAFKIVKCVCQKLEKVTREKMIGTYMNTLHLCSKQWDG